MLFTEAALMSTCEASLINGLGYNVADSAITASNYYESDELCQPHKSRQFESTNQEAWCAGVYTLIYNN